MSKLKSKIAVITGGASGIGLATARRFVAEGAFVYLVGRRQEALDAAAALGRRFFNKSFLAQRLRGRPVQLTAAQLAGGAADVVGQQRAGGAGRV